MVTPPEGTTCPLARARRPRSSASRGRGHPGRGGAGRRRDRGGPGRRGEPPREPRDRRPRLRQVEVERVEELDGRARRMHRHVLRDVEERLGVVEDDLHAGLDHRVGDALRGFGRDGEHRNDDVLLADVLAQLVVLEMVVPPIGSPTLAGLLSNAAEMLNPWSAKIVELAIAWPSRPAPISAMLCCPCVRRIFRISAIRLSML